MKEYKIEGVNRPYCLGVKALDEFNQLGGPKIDDNLKMLSLIAWLAFRSGALHSGKQFNEPVSTVTRWLDQDFDLFNDILKDVNYKFEKFINNKRH